MKNRTVSPYRAAWHLADDILTDLTGGPGDEEDEAKLVLAIAELHGGADLCEHMEATGASSLLLSIGASLSTLIKTPRDSFPFGELVALQRTLDQVKGHAREAQV